MPTNKLEQDFALKNLCENVLSLAHLTTKRENHLKSWKACLSLRPHLFHPSWIRSFPLVCTKTFVVILRFFLTNSPINDLSHKTFPICTDCSYTETIKVFFKCKDSFNCQSFNLTSICIKHNHFCLVSLDGYLFLMCPYNTCLFFSSQSVVCMYQWFNYSLVLFKMPIILYVCIVYVFEYFNIRASCV